MNHGGWTNVGKKKKLEVLNHGPQNKNLQYNGLKLIKKNQYHLLQIKRRWLQNAFSNVNLNVNWKKQSNAKKINDSLLMLQILNTKVYSRELVFFNVTYHCQKLIQPYFSCSVTLMILQMLLLFLGF